MSTRTETFYWIRCDIGHCDERYPKNHGERSIRAVFYRAKMLGWHARGEIDYCPGHAEQRETE